MKKPFCSVLTYKLHILKAYSENLWKSLIPTCRENNGKEAEKIVTGSAWLSLITFYFGCKILPINTIFALMHTANNYQQCSYFQSLFVLCALTQPGTTEYSNESLRNVCKTNLKIITLLGSNQTRKRNISIENDVLHNQNIKYYIRVYVYITYI